MTRYYDKTGAEILEGDFLLHVTGTSAAWPHAQKVDPRTEGWTIIHRADGAPVFRYMGGEDVRDGDTFRAPDGAVVSGAGPFLGRSHWANDAEIEETRKGWAQCTLVSRAGESERPKCRFSVGDKVRDDTLGNRGYVAEIRADSLIVITDAGDGLFYSFGAQSLKPDWEAEEKEQSPILGHDRNGREVRRGDIVKNATTSLVVHHRGKVAGKNDEYAFFSDAHDGGIFESAAELVTDEKAEPTMPIRNPPKPA